MSLTNLIGTNPPTDGVADQACDDGLLVEAEPGFFLRDAIRFSFESVGTGSPLVLSHALGRDKSQVAKYIGVPAGCRVIRWDSRAHGDTSPLGSVDQLQFETFADDLRSLLDHFNFPQAILGGISMGAATTATFSCRWPHRVRAAILIRPAWLDQPNPQHLRPFVELGLLLKDDPTDEVLASLKRSEFYLDLSRRFPQAAQQVQSLLEDRLAFERVARLTRIPATVPIKNWQQVSAMTMPVLLVACRNDPFHPLDVAEQWAARLPNAELVVISSTLEDRLRHTHELRNVIQQFLHSYRLS
jgi:pimeloyl-ACP methyl ester carboxylesterase